MCRQLEQDWLLKKKLKYGQGTPLLTTIGADSDYCEKKELVKDMQASIQKLRDTKRHGPDAKTEMICSPCGISCLYMLL